MSSAARLPRESPLSKMKRWLLIAPTVLLLAAVAAVFFFAQAVRPEVVVRPATTGTAVDAVTGTVKLFATLDLRLTTDMEGRVREIHVGIGDQVEEGDLLVELAARDTALQLESRRVQLEAAREHLDLGFEREQDMANLTDLVETGRRQAKAGSLPRSEVERRERELEKARIALARDKIRAVEQVRLLETEIARLENQIERMQLRAPFKGTVVEILVLQADWLFRGDQVLRLISPEVFAELTLSEEDFYGVQKGQRVELHVASFPGRTFPGEVDWVEAVANPDQKVRKLTVKILEGTDELVPGLTGEASLVKAERNDAVLVPRRALLGDRLYVLEDGRARMRPVEVGFLGLHRAEIRSGLEPGEEVVVEGQIGLRDGDWVRTVGETGP